MRVLSYMHLPTLVPVDAVTSARMKDPGEVVDASGNVLTIADPSQAVVAVRLSENQASAIQTGDRAEVAINGSSSTVAGSVSTVNASLDPATRTL